MPRRQRLHVEGGFYHVTMRGNHRQRLFFNGEHRAILDGLVSQATERYGMRVHAYCWMSNHIHILVEVSDIPLGRIMMWVASRHARLVQRELITTGHLFERRYHSLLVDKDSYLLELIRYIHLNPVHAGIVHDPILYRWSSHMAYMGVQCTPWVTTDFALKLFHPEVALARSAYGKYVRDGIGAPFDPTLLIAHRKDPRILGGDGFAGRMLPRRPKPKIVRKTLNQLIDDCCKRYSLTPDALQSRSRMRKLTRARAWVACQALNQHIAELSSIARAFRRDESSLRELIKRYEPEFGGITAGGTALVPA